ncbi:hypothetical protein HDU76_013402 [Blyttiomyces sp. JEL0837]|nr:hypothetical protein HDU76_013402 [Blyttiomyces sp. JEL0837]
MDDDEDPEDTANNATTTTQEQSGSQEDQQRVRKRLALACDRCREKKRKCDGKKPVCNNCAKAQSRAKGAHVVCVYQEPSKKRGRKRGPEQPADSHYKQELFSKLNALESLLKPLQSSGLVPQELLGLDDKIMEIIEQNKRQNTSGGSSSERFLEALSSLGVTDPTGNDPLASVLRGSIATSVTESGAGSTTSGDDDDGDVRMTSAQAFERLVQSSERLNAAINKLPATTLGSLDFINTITSTASSSSDMLPTPESGSTSAITAVNSGILTSSPSSGIGTPSNELTLSPSSINRRTSMASSSSNHLAFPNNPSWDFAESMFMSPSLSMVSNLSDFYVDEIFLQSPEMLGATFPTFATPPMATSNLYNSFQVPTESMPAPMGTATNPGANMFAPAGYVPRFNVSVFPSKTRSAHADLNTHLVAVFFTYFNPAYNLLSEDLFLADYVPVNRHPRALVYAILGFGALFSRHHLLLKQHKSSLKASQHYMKLAEEHVATTEDNVSAIQTMILLGTWEYLVNFGMQAYRWIGLASREAEKINIQLETQGCLGYRFLVWRGPTAELAPAQVQVRLKAFANIFALDAHATIVSGLPTCISEDEYLGFFAEWEEAAGGPKDKMGNFNDRGRSSEVVSRSGYLGPREWMRTFETVPSDTIFDAPWSPYPHPVKIRLMSKIGAGDEESLRRKDRTPIHLMTDGKGIIYYLQVCYFARRVRNYVTYRKYNAKFTGLAKHLKSVTAPPPTVDALHESMMDWYHDLPNCMKPFKSLDDFSDLNYNSRPKVPPFGSPNPLAGAEADYLDMLLLYFCVLAILHDPTSVDKDNPQLFKVSGEPGARKINSLQVTVLISRAVSFIIKCIYAGHNHPIPTMAMLTEADNRVAEAAGYVDPSKGGGGGGGGNTSSTPKTSTDDIIDIDTSAPSDSSSSAPPPPKFPPLPEVVDSIFGNVPAPPALILQIPLLSFVLYVSSFSLLSAVVPGVVLEKDLKNFASLPPCPDVDGPWEALEDIRDVIMPVIFHTAKLWRISEIYHHRLQELMPEALRRLPTRGNVPKDNNRYQFERSSFVENVVPEMEVYMRKQGPVASNGVIGMLPEDPTMTPVPSKNSSSAPSRDKTPEVASGSIGSPDLMDAIASIIRGDDSC